MGDLLRRFLRGLTRPERDALSALAGLASHRGSAVHLVGGSVRDLLLGRNRLDLDYVVETDAPALAHRFGRDTGAHVTVHGAFRTATVRGEGYWFDLVTARREWYPSPGALPEVESAALADDLARRDFTINAMALTVSGAKEGALHDPHGGRADLAAYTLRTLHADSFRDDATRLWRGGRYAARLCLTPDPDTADQIRRHAGYVATISPARIRHELERILAEPAPEDALRILHRWGVLATTLPALACTDDDAAALRAARRQVFAERRLVELAVLALGWDGPDIEQAIVRLALDRSEARVVRAVPAAGAALGRLAAVQARASTASEALEAFPAATLAAYAARWPDRAMGRLAQTYLADWRRVRPALTGDDLIRIGVAAGPAIGAALRALRAARLDGEVVTLDDELRLLHTMMAAPDPTG